MKVLITGGTGFVGAHLKKHYIDSGHHVVLTGTRPTADKRMQNGLTYIQADTALPGKWQNAVSEADLIINLAGRTIFKRWSDRYKKIIYNSRISTTRHIVEAILKKDTVLISASGVGYYGNGADRELTETAEPGDDFLAALSRDWESEALRAREKGAHVVLTRFGIVLGKDGGALSAMLPAFRWCLGGPIGSGRQWFPWIHITDLVTAIYHLGEQGRLRSGVYNVCSPNPVSNHEFAKTLGRVLKRPSVLPVPAFTLKLVFGQMAAMLLTGQRALPAKLLDSGFQFKYPLLQDALMNLLE